MQSICSKNMMHCKLQSSSKCDYTNHFCNSFVIGYFFRVCLYQLLPMQNKPEILILCCLFFSTNLDTAIFTFPWVGKKKVSQNDGSGSSWLKTKQYQRHWNNFMLWQAHEPYHNIPTLAHCTRPHNLTIWVSGKWWMVVREAQSTSNNTDLVSREQLGKDQEFASVKWWTSHLTVVVLILHHQVGQLYCGDFAVGQG